MTGTECRVTRSCRQDGWDFPVHKWFFPNWAMATAPARHVPITNDTIATVSCSWAMAVALARIAPMVMLKTVLLTVDTVRVSILYYFNAAHANGLTRQATSWFVMPREVIRRLIGGRHRSRYGLTQECL